MHAGVPHPPLLPHAKQGQLQVRLVHVQNEFHLLRAAQASDVLPVDGLDEVTQAQVAVQPLAGLAKGVQEDAAVHLEREPQTTAGRLIDLDQDFLQVVGIIASAALPRCFCCCCCCCCIFCLC
jgi:hypothetical protein